MIASSFTFFWISLYNVQRAAGSGCAAASSISLSISGLT